MMKKSLQFLTCGMALFMLLIPCAVMAQNEDQPYSRQTFSQEELAQMLAPIALYPDPLLSQILMAATYPFEVVEAQRWLTKNPYIKGDALDEALQSKDWDVSILALCHYPKVLTMMSDNLNWTARLGDAFANQEAEVMDVVQELRARARAAGNLSTTAEQNVIEDDRYIQIEPISPDYIYVPAYDPYVVYGHWWLPLFPPFPIILPGLVVTGPGIVFSPRYYVGFGVFGWSSFNWRERNVIIVNIDRTRRYNRHVHQYRYTDRHHWRPDRERRNVRERRAGEIPRFRPPVRPAPSGERWDRRPGGDVIQPDRRRTPDQPRILNKEKSPAQPRSGDQGRRPDVIKPGPANPEKQPQWNQPENRKGSPDRDRRIIDRSPAQPGPGTMEKRQPAIRDRGSAERIAPGSSPPRVEQKNIPGADKTYERNTRDGGRIAPREERGAPERWDRPGRGGMNREDRK